MSETVRAKFQVTKREAGGGVTLEAVYSSDENHENKAFWEATPSGKLEMWINVPDAASFFELGEEYYLDFTKAGE